MLSVTFRRYIFSPEIRLDAKKPVQTLLRHCGLHRLISENFLQRKIASNGFRLKEWCILGLVQIAVTSRAHYDIIAHIHC